jgi:hypothetical protein
MLNGISIAIVSTSMIYESHSGGVVSIVSIKSAGG